MNILRMQYFVDVARLENMTRAAQQNYISQTAMSQQIANIERELEVKLFVRDKGRLKLTDAGRVFYERCERILEMYAGAVQETQAAFRNQFCRSSVTVGVLTSTTVDFLEGIIDDFAARYPGISVKLVQCTFPGMRSNMENGLLDCIICPEFNAVGIKNTQTAVLTCERVGLLVSKKNPLAKKDAVYVDEIKDEKIIMTAPEFAGTSYGPMFEACARCGYKPNVVQFVQSAEVHRLMVALNQGSAYIPEKRAIYDHARCKILHIIDRDDWNNLVIAWHSESGDEQLRYFVGLVEKFFKTDYDKWLDNYVQQQSVPEDE